MCVRVYLHEDRNYEEAVLKLESARIEWESRMQEFCKVMTWGIHSVRQSLVMQYLQHPACKWSSSAVCIRRHFLHKCFGIYYKIATRYKEKWHWFCHSYYRTSVTSVYILDFLVNKDFWCSWRYNLRCPASSAVFLSKHLSSILLQWQNRLAMTIS